jgi:hypothetical protein
VTTALAAVLLALAVGMAAVLVVRRTRRERNWIPIMEEEPGRQR